MTGYKVTPWDERVFGFKTYEIEEIDEDVFKEIDHLPGHFTIRVSPLHSKRLLHQFGFYYCDTLIEPFCRKESFQPVFQEGLSVQAGLDPAIAVDITKGAYLYDRFHRDFHIRDADADDRYAQWIQEIKDHGSLYSLWSEESLAGYFACQENKILLHAMKSDFQGKGLAKYFWSRVCHSLFEKGYKELTSSISAANMAVLNLYKSIGFSFRNPVDIYHKFNPPNL